MPCKPYGLTEQFVNDKLHGVRFGAENPTDFQLGVLLGKTPQRFATRNAPAARRDHVTPVTWQSKW